MIDKFVIKKSFVREDDCFFLVFVFADEDDSVDIRDD